MADTDADGDEWQLIPQQTVLHESSCVKEDAATIVISCWQTAFPSLAFLFIYFRLAAALDATGSNNNNTVCISESHPSDKNMSFCLSDDSDLSVANAIKTKLYMFKWSI